MFFIFVPRLSNSTIVKDESTSGFFSLKLEKGNSKWTIGLSASPSNSITRGSDLGSKLSILIIRNLSF